MQRLDFLKQKKALTVILLTTLLSFNSFAEETEKSELTETAAESVAQTKVAQAEESESESIEPNFADLERLRDFDHDLVDFSTAPKRSYKQNFKDEVLAFCISTAYQDTATIRDDALYTAAALHDWGRFELEESIESVTALVAEHLGKVYRYEDSEPTEHVERVEGAEKTEQPQEVKLLKCMDLYHSPDLEELAKEYVIDADRSYAEDHAHTP